MKKLWRFILPLILLYSLAAQWAGADCLVTGELNNEQYGYTEKLIPNDFDGKNVTMMKINHRNELVFHVHDFKAGFSEYFTMDTTGKILKSFIYKDGIFALDSRDNVYILDAPLSRVCVVNSKGIMQNEIRSDQISYSPTEPGYHELSVDSKGIIYGLIPGTSIVAFFQNGRSGKVLKTGRYWCMDITPKGNLILGGYNSQNSKPFLEMFNPSSGRTLWKTDLGVGESVRSVKYNPANRMIYLAGDKGVKKYSEQGPFIEDTLDFKQTSLLENNYYIWSMAVSSDETLYFWVRTSPVKANFTYGLYQYKLTAALKTPVKTLTINVRYSNPFLESAIAKFQRLHPDIRIQVRDFKAAWYGNDEKGPSQVEDARARRAVDNYIKTNLAELMAGKGADLIDVTSLPYQKYIAKDFLMNLSEMIASDPKFDLQSLRPNLITACKYQNKLYIIPVDFSLRLLSVNRALIPKTVKFNDQKWTWDDFLQAALAATKDTNHDGKPEQYALPKVKPRESFTFLLNYQYHQFINYEKKTASFQSTRFINLLQTVKQLYERKIMHPKLDYTGLWQMTDPGTIAFIPFYLSGLDSLIMQQGLFNGGFDLLRYPDSPPDEHQFWATLFAINKNTPYPKEAWDFIKFLVSQEVQSASNLYSFPINVVSFNEKAESILKESWAYDYYRTRKKRKIKDLTRQDIERVNSLINRLNRIASDDYQIIEIIEKETQAYLNSKVTAEAAAKAIQKQVTSYLNE
jgi:multiple sugar transport system substrate-binding protein